MQAEQTGTSLINQTFAKARSERRAAFMPYFTIGFPTYEESIDVIENLAKAGADIIEVGVPFSDSIADGPTVQHSLQVALNNKTTVKRCIEAIRTLRERGVTVPLVMMGSYNPLIAYGLERYVQDAVAAGASGFIVPDLPPEEATELNSYCEAQGASLISMLAPTSTPERIRQVVSKARGFLYLVSVTGVTGARASLPPDIADYVRRVRTLTTLPLVVGFGISRPEHARDIASIADGVVVGSAMIRAMETAGAQAVTDLAVSLRGACGKE